MLRINLLPWREQQRQAALRRLRLMLVGGVLLALCVVLLMDQLARQRAQQQAMANVSQQAVIAGLTLSWSGLKAPGRRLTRCGLKLTCWPLCTLIEGFWSHFSPTWSVHCLRVFR